MVDEPNSFTPAFNMLNESSGDIAEVVQSLTEETPSKEEVLAYRAAAVGYIEYCTLLLLHTIESGTDAS